MNKEVFLMSFFVVKKIQKIVGKSFDGFGHILQPTDESSRKNSDFTIIF